MHDYEVIRTVFDKSKPFDPKTMPIADYSKRTVCKTCGYQKESEIGYIIDGKDLPYGMTMLGLGNEPSGCPVEK